MTFDHLHQARSIHLIGVKGVGMTALALCLQAPGVRLTGSDTAAAQITDSSLKRAHIPVTGFHPENITPDLDLVIYSGAYSRHPELLRARQLNLPLLSQAEAVALLAKNQPTVCVCGVGGKTTTTAMLAYLFDQLGRQPGWFVGSSHFAATYPPGRYRSGSLFFLEADEYAVAPPEDNRPKLSLYSPETIVCTNIAFDHPDIYRNLAHTQATFKAFFASLPESGYLLINAATPDLDTLLAGLPHKPDIHTFGAAPGADWQLAPGSQPNRYTVSHQGRHYPLSLKLPGLANAANAAAALAVAVRYGLAPEAVLAALSRFAGVARRFELVRESAGILYYDDYAHHPHEVAASLAAFKASHPDRRLVVIFQPHTYSRTKSLFAAFAAAFADADHLILAPIFSSAREAADASISSQQLAQAISRHQPSVVFLPSTAKIVSHLRAFRQPGDLILTLGAGDIYSLHLKL